MTSLQEKPELILEDGARIRRTIDKHICSLTLKPKTNDPTEEYRLAVSAHFGVERLPIYIGEELIDFKFEIFKAEIVLDPAMCQFDTQFEHDRSVLERIMVDPEGYTKTAQSRFHLDTGEMLESVTGLKAGVEHKIDTKDGALAWFEFTFVDEATLTITSRGKQPIPLSGALLDEFVGWNVIPLTGVDSGVLGRIRVREEWIRLVDPVHEKGPQKIYRQIKVLLGKDQEDVAYQRKSFHALLTHLVAEGLQNEHNTKEATLAMDTVIVRPAEAIVGRVLGEPAVPLRLAGTVISRFLVAPVQEIQTVLMENGVDPERLVHPPPKVSLDRSFVYAEDVFKAILDEYFKQLEISRFAIAEHGTGRLRDTILDAIWLPGTYQTVFQLLSIYDQHDYKIRLRKRRFEALITLAELTVLDTNEPNALKKRAVNKWLGQHRSEYDGYEIMIGDFCSSIFGATVYLDFLERNMPLIENQIEAIISRLPRNLTEALQQHRTEKELHKPKL